MTHVWCSTSSCHDLQPALSAPNWSRSNDHSRSLRLLIAPSWLPLSSRKTHLLNKLNVETHFWNLWCTNHFTRTDCSTLRHTFEICDVQTTLHAQTAQRWDTLLKFVMYKRLYTHRLISVKYSLLIDRIWQHAAIDAMLQFFHKSKQVLDYLLEGQAERKELCWFFFDHSRCDLVLVF